VVAELNDGLLLVESNTLAQDNISEKSYKKQSLLLLKFYYGSKF
jgi:hypothetical protein